MSTLQTTFLKHPDAAGNNIAFDSSGHATFSNTVKTSKIENASTTNGGVEIDSDGHVQVDGLQFPTTGPLSNRNLVINGEFLIAQRGTTFTYEGTGQSHTIYNLDRFTTQAFGTYPSGDYLTITRETDVPTVAQAGTKFAYSQKIEVLQTLTFSASTARGIWTRQSFEGFNTAQLNWGATGAATITLSFWIKATKTGDFTVTLKDSTSTLSYNTVVTVAAANTWQYVSKTIAGPTSGGTFHTDNQAGLSLVLAWSIDPTWIAGTQTDQWVAANETGTTTQTQMLITDGDAVWMTGLQFEVGNKATPFEHRSCGDTLAACQRYYQRYCLVGGNDGAPVMRGSVISGASELTFTLPSPMRTGPSISNLSTNNQLEYRRVHSSNDEGNVTISSLSSDHGIDDIIDNLNQHVRVRFTPSLTDGEPYVVFSNGQGNIVLEASAEL